MKRWSWLFLALSGCFQMVYPMPQWVFEVPEEKGYIYAVGSGGYSISWGEAKELAIQNGLVKLAQSLGTKMVVRTVQGKEQGRIFGRAKVVEMVTEKALEQVELVAFWSDPKGVAGMGPRVFVLLRIPDLSHSR